jgi:Ca2+-transporting ATPase
MGGLSKEEARVRLEQVGYNELEKKKKGGWWRFLLSVFSEPLFFLLVGAATLYVVLGDYQEGLVLSMAMVLIIAITFFQKQRSSRALEALKNLSAPRALVLRDGRAERIPGREVVPGDWLLLSAGDRVAADATLLESSGLYADESLVSGESVSVHKTVAGTSQLLAGSMIVSGKGVAVVSATGVQAQLGKIGHAVQQVKERRSGLQIAAAKLTKKLLWLGFFISAAVVLAYFFSRGNFLAALLHGLSASMAILPEEFPVVMTIFLAVGAWRIAQNNVLTRNPSAIESLGAATVLCADKTGTITQNKMVVAQLYDGTLWLDRASFSKRGDSFRTLLRVARHASEIQSVDPMDVAIIEAYSGWDSTFVDLSLIKEYPLQDDLLAVTRVMQTEKKHDLLVAAKGAPETIFRLCNLSDQEELNYHKALHTMAERGYRVLGVASASIETTRVPDHPSGFKFTFLGLLGFEDPIRPETKEAMESCRHAGIRLVMITGDHPATAKKIAEEIGLSGKVMTGDEIEKLEDETLTIEVNNCRVYARILPSQKLRLVKAFHKNGEVVAMMGDGVNDAPALKAADIGIAMGKKGTDVAREAADLVLLDDNLISVVRAISLGRRIYSNLQKAMLYILSIHIPIVGLVLIPAFGAELPTIMLPVQIVFLELIIDPVCSVAFESQPGETGQMRQPPREKEALFFSGWFFKRSFFVGTLLLVVVFLVYWLGILWRLEERLIRGSAFLLLVVGNVFLISSMLSLSQPFYISFVKNRAAQILLFLALLLVGGIFFIPTLRELFKISLLPGWLFFLVILGAFLFLLVLELVKLGGNKKSRTES